MKFLCLHGAIGNPENFRVQLDGFCKELENDKTAAFSFARGFKKVEPPEGFEDYFGPGPHYRFFDDQGLAETSMLERVRTMREQDTPEETLRGIIINDPPAGSVERLNEMFVGIRGLLEQEPDVEGLIGYSEGASAAASLILDEARKLESDGTPRRIKCAIFFAGWPPLGADSRAVLSDESEEMIEIPTCHVIGAGDPYLSGSMALYNICNEDTATLFDHGKGHTLPRDQRTLKELGDAVRKLIEQSKQF